MRAVMTNPIPRKKRPRLISQLLTLDGLIRSAPVTGMITPPSGVDVEVGVALEVLVGVRLG